MARKLAIIGLVLLILLLVLPLGIAMAMGACPDCTLGTQHPGQCCVTLAVTASLLLLSLTVQITPTSRRIPLLLLSDLLDRPPRGA